MNCPGCKKQITDNSNICTFCGTIINENASTVSSLPKLKKLSSIESVKQTVAQDQTDKSTTENPLHNLKTLKPLSSINVQSSDLNKEEIIKNTATLQLNESVKKNVESKAVSPIPSVAKDTKGKPEETAALTPERKSFFKKKNEVEEPITEKKENQKSKTSFFKKKNKTEESKNEGNISDHAESSVNATVQEDEMDIYDTNLDGYYDDLIPDLARQINKIPQENIIKLIIIIVCTVIIGIMMMLMMN